ncbi:Dipeptide-binding protein DppE [Apilactobacillus kunkeei]|uniref:Peptide ABC transporter substrate-binding protein n=1 Tax=Apilactobacillus nanyangensis TaxID=2799579 RepID=A0ABT0HVT8_9LACO|nr:peptide ABC transporter substrate-binding protein [Apilactobacillus nanyangensis]MCK8611011.1 peptide ABC transporter substrate-binding protein [Apilactobacillus nanyangensis]CAI2699326.1 Dipeptide-binding protein DppE [Apilactobacillus kunkeei]
MKNKHKLLLGSMFSLLALGLAACSSGKASTKALRFSEPTTLMTLDQSKLVDQVSDVTLNNSNEGLLVMTKNGKVVPGVAKSYSVSKDGKTYTFKLRHSKWSDGSEVTAADFVNGFQRTENPKTAAAYQYLLEDVKNADAVAKGKKPVSALGVSAEGKYEFKVQLDKPESYFKYVVTMAPTYPQSAKEEKKYGSGYATSSDKQLYNGPYKVTGWTGTNDTWKLVKNNEYWNKDNVKVRQLDFSVSKDPSTTMYQFEQGNLDSMVLSGKNQVNNYKNSKQYHARKEAGTYYLEMNQTKNKLLKNVNVRKALSLAVDRNQLTKSVLGNGSVPAKGFVASDMSSYKGKDFADQAAVLGAVSYNLSEAKKLFAKGLKQLGMKSASLSLLADDSSDSKTVTEYLQNQFQKLPGLKVSLENLPSKVATDRTEKGQFDVTLDAWIADFPDPVSFMSLEMTGNGYNHGGWSNKQYDSLMNKANGQDANNFGKRWDDMVAAHKVLLNQQGVVPLYQLVSPQLLSKNVKGLSYYPSGGNFDFRTLE